MANPAQIPFVATSCQRVDTANLTPASVAPLNHSAQTFTVNGLDPIADQFMAISQLAYASGSYSQTAGIVVINAACTATNTLQVVFYNPTGGALTPAAGNYSFIVF